MACTICTPILLQIMLGMSPIVIDFSTYLFPMMMLTLSFAACLFTMPMSWVFAHNKNSTWLPSEMAVEAVS